MDADTELKEAKKPSLQQRFAAAGGASLAAGLITNPLEVVKVGHETAWHR